MLKTLRVKNYVLIEELVLEPGDGLAVITGETGAGKSIILGAISLMLGQRADNRTLRNEDEKCIIEGVFDISAYNLESFFASKDWDFHRECIIRREISTNGRTRAFVNDSPSNVADLQELGGILLDIHSQHDSILLNKAAFQLDIIDALAGTKADVIDFGKLFTEYTKQLERLHDLQNKKALENQDLDYKRFLLNELEEADLQIDEKDSIEIQLKKVENAALIINQLQEVLTLAEEGEINANQLLKDAERSFNKIAHLDEDFSDLSKRLSSSIIELDDIINELKQQTHKIDIDDEKLQTLRERINLIQKLEAKHQVVGDKALIAIQHKISQELDAIDSTDERIEELKVDCAKRLNLLNIAATKISDQRQSIFQSTINTLENIAHELGMPDAKLQIKLDNKALSADGFDKVQILFSANKGQTPIPIKDAASGGETSRLMLALKYIIADKTALPTIIFDEIDTGISGKIATYVGEMLRKMAKEHQVIAISHLPQIAAKGEHHFVVYKENSGEKSTTRIRELSGEDRINEIAQMISGIHISASAISSAKELLEIK